MVKRLQRPPELRTIACGNGYAGIKPRRVQSFTVELAFARRKVNRNMFAVPSQALLLSSDDKRFCTAASTHFKQGTWSSGSSCHQLRVKVGGNRTGACKGT